MSLQTMASQFVELCNQGKNFDAMHAMYAPHIVSVEPAARKLPARHRSSRSPNACKPQTHRRRKGPRSVLQRPQPVRGPFHLRNHPRKPPASGSRWKRSASTRSRTTRSRVSSSSTKVRGNSTSERSTKLSAYLGSDHELDGQTREGVISTNILAT